MSKRREFIRLWKKASMLYVRLNSYAHNFFYANQDNYEVVLVHIPFIPPYLDSLVFPLPT